MKDDNKRIERLCNEQKKPRLSTIPVSPSGQLPKYPGKSPILTTKNKSTAINIVTGPVQNPFATNKGVKRHSVEYLKDKFKNK